MLRNDIIASAGESGMMGKSSGDMNIQIDLREVIELEKLNIRYQDAIERTMDLLLEFWDELLKKKTVLARMFRLGTDINMQFLWIKAAMRTLTEKNPARIEVIYLYKQFVDGCMNLELEELYATEQLRKMIQRNRFKRI